MHLPVLLAALALAPAVLSQGYGNVPQHSNTKRTTTTFAPDVIPSDQQAQTFFEQHQNPQPQQPQQPYPQQPQPKPQQPYPKPQQPYPVPQQPIPNEPYKDNTVVSGSFASSSYTDADGPQQNAGAYWWTKDAPFKGAGPADPTPPACGGNQCGGQPGGISPGNPFLTPGGQHKPSPPACGGNQCGGQPGGISPGNPFLRPEQPQHRPEQPQRLAACGYGGCGGNQEPGLAVTCSGAGYLCVPKASCSNGVVIGGVAQVTGGIQKCDVSSQACCRLQQGPNVRPNPPIKDTRYPPYQGQGSAPGTNGIPIGSSIYDTAPRPVPTYKPYTGPLNTTPYPGCAAALKCVELIYCTAEGVMTDKPVYLTREQDENRVPLSECSNPDTGILGKCCRDPNYKDPWPMNMPMPNMPGQFDQAGFQTGQYFDNSKQPSHQQPSHQHQLNQQGSVNQGPLITHPQPPKVVRQPQPQQPYQPPQQPYQPPQQPYQPPQEIPRPQQPPQQPYQPPQQPYQPPKPQIPRPQQPYQPPQEIPRPQQPYQPNRQEVPQVVPYQPAVPQGRPNQPPTYPQVQPPRPTQVQPGAKCGVKRPADRGGLGEREAGFGEFPWHVLVVKAGSKTPLCSGALISEKAVVTAAHCVQDLDSADLLIEAGVWRLNSPENPRAPQTAPVAAVARHPGHDEGTLANDMAVLLLAIPLQLDQHIDTLCLPRGQPSQQNCVATGYGKQALQANAPGSPLHHLEVNFIPNNVCEQKLKATNLGKYFVLNQSFQCAVPANPDDDLCKVGAGGPVACDRGNNQHELSALYSWDVGCTNPSNPTALTSVDTAWIENVLNSPLQDIVKVELNEIEKKKKSEEVIDHEQKPGFAQGYGK